MRGTLWILSCLTLRVGAVFHELSKYIMNYTVELLFVSMIVDN